MSNLTQARRALAKSRRRVWRMARTIIGPRALAEWQTEIRDDPHGIPHTPTSRAWLIGGNWIYGYCRNDAQRGALRIAMDEFARRRIVLMRLDGRHAD